MDTTHRNRHIYDGMPHRFDPLKLLTQALAAKGLFYPGALIPSLFKDSHIHTTRDRDAMPAAGELRMETLGGTPIRKADAMGRVYFMPVYIETKNYGIEIPAAAISIKGKKNIVETPLTGRRGSVKELVSVDDYEITIHGVIISDDENYPEESVQMFRDLYETNESVKLICALSELVLQPDDRIVIKSIEWPPVGAVENAQIIKMTAVTDSSIDLIIE